MPVISIVALTVEDKTDLIKFLKTLVAPLPGPFLDPEGPFVMPTP